MVDIWKPAPPEAVTQPLPPNEPKSLTPHHATNLFFHSYRHSQGFPEGQRSIFRYLAKRNPHWSMSDTEKDAALALAKPKVLGFANGDNHVTISEEKKLQDLEARMQDMQNAIKNSTGGSDSIVIVTKALILRDAFFLSRDEGRAKSAHDAEKPYFDNWFSFVCHFGLNGNPTGTTEFDQMYQDMARYLRNQGHLPLNREIDCKLDQIIKIHNANHPGQEVHF